MIALSVASFAVSICRTAVKFISFEKYIAMIQGLKFDRLGKD
jgi:hypothetical protein